MQISERMHFKANYRKKVSLTSLSYTEIIVIAYIDIF